MSVGRCGLTYCNDYLGDHLVVQDLFKFMRGKSLAAGVFWPALSGLMSFCIVRYLYAVCAGWQPNEDEDNDSHAGDSKA